MVSPPDAKEILKEIANNNPLEFITDRAPKQKRNSWDTPKLKVKTNPKFRKSKHAFDQHSFLSCLANSEKIIRLCHKEVELHGEHFNRFKKSLNDHEKQIKSVLDKLPVSFRLNFYFLLFYSCGGVFAESDIPLVKIGKNGRVLPEPEVGIGKLKKISEMKDKIDSIDFRLRGSKKNISIDNERTVLKIIGLIENYKWEVFTNATYFKTKRTPKVKSNALKAIAIDFYNCFRAIGITKNKSKGFTGWLLYFSGRIEVEINNPVPKSKQRADKKKSDTDKNMEDKVKGLLSGHKLS